MHHGLSPSRAQMQLLHSGLVVGRQLLLAVQPPPHAIVQPVAPDEQAVCPGHPGYGQAFAVSGVARTKASPSSVNPTDPTNHDSTSELRGMMFSSNGIPKSIESP